MNLYQYFPYHSFNRKRLGRFCLFWYRQFPVVTILKQKVGNCLFLLSIYNDDPFQNTNTNTPFFLQIPQTKAILSSILSTIFYGIVHTTHSPGSISIRYHNSNPSHIFSQTLFDIKIFFGVCGGFDVANYVRKLNYKRSRE